MGNKDKNKYEDFASHFHDEQRIELTDNVRNDADFKATGKIYSLREKVNSLSHLTQEDVAWRRIQSEVKERKSFRISPNPIFFRYAAIFIFLITLAGVSGIILFQSQQSGSKEIFTEIITATGEMKEVLLPDGSKVWIGANSSLKYNNGFGEENRGIIFNGEALFDVEKNDKLSFQIKLDDASVSVHGTKFLVTGYSAGKKNEIVLLEGKVKYQRNSHSFILLPGERVTDNQMTGETIKELINIENYNKWINGNIFLDNSELDNLIFLLEQWYKAKFTFSNDGLKKYKFTGIIDKTKSLDYNLHIISLTNKVKFQKNEQGILIINN